MRVPKSAMAMPKLKNHNSSFHNLRADFKISMCIESKIILKMPGLIRNRIFYCAKYFLKLTTQFYKKSQTP